MLSLRVQVFSYLLGENYTENSRCYRASVENFMAFVSSFQRIRRCRRQMPWQSMVLTLDRDSVCWPHTVELLLLLRYCCFYPSLFVASMLEPHQPSNDTGFQFENPKIKFESKYPHFLDIINNGLAFKSYNS
ncbi:uncharacterized protein A4U43_C04F8920 [Asparagus officinalis]|uniref:Uncharacterized protein n=1 Tax=Asparagus officinalis TaxID=4686 RepID=A0A5P1F165_ASPOF|nr:uncharacterized protein A4U43_C04F8920 [Asparagus officinalis]